MPRLLLAKTDERAIKRWGSNTRTNFKSRDRTELLITRG